MKNKLIHDVELELSRCGDNSLAQAVGGLLRLFVQQQLELARLETRIDVLEGLDDKV